MTAAEFRAAREALGRSVEALADDMQAPPSVVEAWEAGRARIPFRIAQGLTLRVAQRRRDDALAAAGLRSCDWMSSRTAMLVELESPRALKLAHRALDDHERSCPACVARTRYAREHLPPLPAIDRAEPDWVTQQIGRLPLWARPAAVGGCVGGVVATLMTLTESGIDNLTSVPRALGAIVMMVAAGGGGGAVFGIVTGAVGRVLRRVPGLGPTLTGLAATWICVGGALAALSLLGGGMEPVAWALLGAVTSALGIFLGEAWVRPNWHLFHDAAPRDPST